MSNSGSVSRRRVVANVDARLTSAELKCSPFGTSRPTASYIRSTVFPIRTYAPALGARANSAMTERARNPRTCSVATSTSRSVRCPGFIARLNERRSKDRGADASLTNRKSNPSRNPTPGLNSGSTPRLSYYAPVPELVPFAGRRSRDEFAVLVPMPRIVSRPDSQRSNQARDRRRCRHRIGDRCVRTFYVLSDVVTHAWLTESPVLSRLIAGRIDNPPWLRMDILYGPPDSPLRFQLLGQDVVPGPGPTAKAVRSTAKRTTTATSPWSNVPGHVGVPRLGIPRCSAIDGRSDTGSNP